MMRTVFITILSLCIFCIHSSLLSDSYPGFDGIDQNIMQCDKNTQEGTFLFDSGRGITYFALSDTMFYLEYYAPSFYWIGHSAADQSVNDNNLECIACLNKHSFDATFCKTECIVDHIFIVTGQSEDAQTWISLELQINEQLKLPPLKNENEIRHQQLRKVNVCENNGNGHCYSYVHVKYYRNYANIKGDEFMFLDGSNNACFSWITSNPTEGAFVTAVKASTVFNFGAICTKLSTLNGCNYDLPLQSLPNQNIEMIAMEPPIPSNACKKQDLSLIFVLDLSDSINKLSMDLSKEWIRQIISFGQRKLSENGLHFRSSLITFSSKTKLVWNFDETDAQINEKLNNLDRPHNVLIEEGLTFTKDAMQSVIDNVLSTKDKNNQNEQILVVILTDGLPSNYHQNPCSNDEISASFKEYQVRTVVVGIEQGNTFDTVPFECLYYPYSTEKSFVGVENYESLLGHSMYPILIDSAFPIHCDVNLDVAVPSKLYYSEHDFEQESSSHSETLFGGEMETKIDYDESSCIAVEEYVPIRSYVFEKNELIYQKCNELTTEWRLELIDWVYHEKHDRTEYIYSICTSHLKPFNHCKVSDDEHNDISQSLKSIALQMPCDCEVCVGYSVHSMQPNGRFAQLEKAWIWNDLNVQNGECEELTLTLMGYAESVNGNYYLEGSEKYEIGKIEVPNPCNDGLDNMLYPIPHIPNKQSYPNPDAAKCKDIESIDPYYPDYCDGICDVRQMEYSVNFAQYKYNKGSDKTIFTYTLRTLKPANLPRDFCSYYPWEQPIPLKEIHISVPCECQHLIQNGNALMHATEGMMPTHEKNGISEYFWHFTNLNVKVGEEKNVTIVMNGMIPFGMGDYTLIGDMDRCGYGRHVIRVPDICNNRCLWGQWTKWDTQWTACSKKCGGGITKRTRKCVSVCDGKTPVFNCYGEAEEITPCNTQKCDGYTMSDQYISSARYWSAG